MKSKIIKVEYLVYIALTVLIGGLVYAFWQDLKDAFWGSERMGRVVLPEEIIRIGVAYITSLFAIHRFKFKPLFELRESLRRFIFFVFVNSFIFLGAIFSFMLFDIYSFDSIIYISLVVNLIILGILSGLANSYNESMINAISSIFIVLLLSGAFLVYQIEHFQLLSVTMLIALVSAIFASVLSRLTFK